ncbi:MAG: hypothetical protein HY075_02540, partial [Deltaproteobacteria bacterium]|nr:hypothetical protein [Deltaproteobacteria bacterium]
MKKFKDVEAERRQYHAAPTVNSVHRSSLMVPEVEGTIAEISMLNHFLVKRGYPKVACRITAIDSAGKRIQSKLFQLTEPRVYPFRLTGMFDRPANTYNVEFFSADNLFIPYTAVMVNHHGKGFLSQVHAYNRILNDVFEDDAINSYDPGEVAMDMELDEHIDTFVVLSSGNRAPGGKLRVEVLTADERYSAERELTLSRMNGQRFSVRETFPQLPKRVRGVLKFYQPHQDMFYGRLLVGLHSTKDGAVSSNHSYYERSKDAGEYWDTDAPSERSYPFFKGLENLFLIYPTMSAGEYDLEMQFRGKDGRVLKSVPLGRLKSPGNQLLEPNANELAAKAGIPLESINTFSLVVRALGGGKMPTRVNHHLVHRSKNGVLRSSINMSLLTPNTFVPPGKKSFTWGQGVVSDDLDSWISLVGDD